MRREAHGTSVGFFFLTNIFSDPLGLALGLWLCGYEARRGPDIGILARACASGVKGGEEKTEAAVAQRCRVGLSEQRNKIEEQD